LLRFSVQASSLVELVQIYPTLRITDTIKINRNIRFCTRDLDLFSPSLRLRRLNWQPLAEVATVQNSCGCVTTTVAAAATHAAAVAEGVTATPSFAESVTH
jgi:hypothetical protein